MTAEELAARVAAEAFWAAVRTGDGAAITSLMSPKAREDLVRYVRRWVPDVSTAEEAAERVWGGSWTEVFSSVVIDPVELQGSQAVAHWQLPALDYGRPDDDDYVVLAKVGGRWVVDSFPDDDDPDERPSWA